MLQEWELLLERGAFVKVMPHDYKRVLRELAEEEALAAAPPATAVRRRAAARRGRRGRRLMGKLGGFLQIERHGIPQRDPVERVGDYREFQLQRPVAELRDQGARCMDCGVPFCHNGCPLGNLIPDWNDLVYRDRFEDAIAQLHATNNFPEFTGRLCPAPCEAACVLEIREGDAVTIKQIENAIINRAWEEGWVAPQPPRRDRETGQAVAVVGSGPAGMAAAQQLRRAGHGVTLFERDEATGGLVRFGVPDFKIEKSLVQRRVEQLVAEGVELRCGVDVGRDVTCRSCGSASRRSCWRPARGYRATCRSPAASSTGCTSRWTTCTSATAGWRASSGRQPTVPQPPIEREITAAGKDVVVIGGGDTGADCVGNALREGARSIVQLELLPSPPAHRPDDRTPWPQWPPKYRLSYAMEEARERGVGEQDYSVATTAFPRRRRGGGGAADRPGRAGASVRAARRHRARAARAAGAAGDGLPAPRAGAARPARRREGPPRQRQGGDAVHDLGGGRVRGRRRAPRPVADRVGDQRGPPVRAHGRPLPARRRHGRRLARSQRRRRLAGHGDADEGPEGPPQHVDPASAPEA